MMESSKLNPIVWLFRVLPLNLMSRLTGALVHWEFPYPFNTYLNRIFVRIFRINENEFAKPLEEYRSIGELFAREIRRRPFPHRQVPKMPHEESLSSLTSEFSSPCDGTLKNFGPVKDDQIFQVKHLQYGATELAFGQKERLVDSWSFFLEFYLAPKDYHRVHMPYPGQLIGIDWIPGKLWPVNPYFTSRVPKIFLENERVSFHFRTPDQSYFSLVMIAALNVGNIQSPLFDFSTNRAHEPKRLQVVEKNIHFNQGEYLAHFSFGSSVVLLLDEALGERHFKMYHSRDMTAAPPKGIKPILVGENLEDMEHEFKYLES